MWDNFSFYCNKRFHLFLIQEAFVHLKSLLAHAPVLITPDRHKQYVLTTDASDYALGAALFHIVDGKERPVAYWGRKLNEHEVKYNKTEREALTVVEALKQFRVYLWGVNGSISLDRSARGLDDVTDGYATSFRVVMKRS